MSRAHVFSLMDCRQWKKDESQFRYHNSVHWDDDDSLIIDGDYLRAMVTLAVSAGVGLKGGIYTVLNMILDANTTKIGSATTHDLGPCVLITPDFVASRPQLERYLDDVPHERLIAAYKLGTNLERSMKQARELFN